MGIGGIGIWQLLIILVIVLLLFGTKKLRNLGGDLGGAIKGFKKAAHDSGDKGDGEGDKGEEIAHDAAANASEAADAPAEPASAPAEQVDGKKS